MFDHLLSILYPKLCLVCKNHLLQQEDFLCLYCIQKINWVPYCPGNLPYLLERFYGKFTFEYVQSLLFYDHDGMSKELLHHLKYKNKPELGEWFAQWTFHKWRQHPIFQTVDAIVKIPIHPKKLKQRGYNQLDIFATTLGKLFHIPVVENCVERIDYSQSQTFKNIHQRSYSKEIFALNNPLALKGKHALIVDDVITTGNTMSQMANLLLEIDGVKISVFGIATAK